jgi:hypothetical protein
MYSSDISYSLHCGTHGTVLQCAVLLCCCATQLFKTASELCIELRCMCCAVLLCGRVTCCAILGHTCSSASLSCGARVLASWASSQLRSGFNPAFSHTACQVEVVYLWYTHTHTRTHAYTHIHTHAHMRTCAHAHTRTHAHTHAHTCAHTHAHTAARFCKCVWCASG